MKKTTIVNIAYCVITLPGIAIFAYLEFKDIIPSSRSYGLLFVAIMSMLRTYLVKKLS